MAAYIVAQTHDRRGEIRTSTPVERIEHDRVILKGGESIMAETITVAMGVTPSPLVCWQHGGEKSQQVARCVAAAELAR